MKLFQRLPTCKECGVAFEPRRDDYDYLCLPHASPKMEIDRRKRAVGYWAEANWERLEPEMLKEQEELRKKMNESLRPLFEQQAEQMHPVQLDTNQMSGFGGNVLSGLFGGQKLF